MTEFADLILQSGRAGVELALFVLLPVMIIMLTIMRLLEAKGILDRFVDFVSPFLRPFGIAGLGVFALIQILFVSFAAPVATLTMMDKSRISRRHIAATLAMVFTIAQSNVVFPMATLGLNVGFIMLTSVVAGLIAASLTYHVFARNLPDEEENLCTHPAHPNAKNVKGLLAVINSAGQEAFNIAIGSIPMLVLALFIVNILRSSGVMGSLEGVLAPIFVSLSFPSEAVLPIVTKYIAGGTAMMGVTVEYLQDGIISVAEFNRMAGFMIHPFDLAGIAILISAGSRVSSVFKPAAYGAIIAILLRSAVHIWYF